MKTKAVAIRQEDIETGFRAMPHASRNAALAVLLALALGLSSVVTTALSLAF